MYAVVDRDQEGHLPTEEVPVVVSFAEDTEYDNSEHNTPENACHLADMDNDGRLDLVLPGPRRVVGSNNRFVGFTIHRGVAEGFFDPQGQTQQLLLYAQ